MAGSESNSKSVAKQEKNPDFFQHTLYQDLNALKGLLFHNGSQGTIF